MDSHKPLTAGEIEALRKLEAKATPGPWAWEFTGDDNACAVGTVMDENDNFISGMVGQDADTVVVDSVCPEVSNQQDAAFIAAARNAFPRLLSLLTPPPDAAVREAVEHDDKLARAITQTEAALLPVEQEYEDNPSQGVFWFQANIWHIRTLLRAVQAPRLTGEQVEAVKGVYKMAKDWVEELGECDHDADVCYCGERRELEFFRAAFPEAFAGEVGRG